MYRLKEYLDTMKEQVKYLDDAHISSVVDDATAELQRLEQREKDYPQDVADAFAAAALVGLLANPQNDLTFTEHARQAWLASEHMMHQRAKRITERRQS